jgi:antiphage defense system Thoeris ThsB-like protein
VSPAQKTRVFISFDYDHDQDLKNLLVGQSRNKQSPFLIDDWSIKKETKGWKADARKRIRRSDVVIVICGHYTHQASGVTTEVDIAREEDVPFHLLRGRPQGWVRRPRGTSWLWDTLHSWTWNNLCSLITRKR